MVNELTVRERADFQSMFASRLSRVKARMEDVFAFRRTAAPPFQVNAALYHLFGLAEESIPGEYFTSPAVMTAFQERTYYEQVREIDDDFVPCLVPWFGTAVMASALGCGVPIPTAIDTCNSSMPGFTWWWSMASHTSAGQKSYSLCGSW